MWLLISATISSMAQGEDRLATCEADYLAQVDDWNGCACFYHLAREPRLRSAASLRLQALTRQRPELACPFFYLASLTFEDGGDPAREFRKAADLYTADGQFRGAYYTQMSLGRWLRSRSLFEDARTEMERGIAIARRLEEPALLDAAEVELLTLALEQGGDLGEIEERLQELLGRIDPSANPQLELEAMHLLAQARFRLGDLDLARTSFETLAERQQRLGNAYAAVTARFNATMCGLPGLPSEPLLRQAKEQMREVATLAAAAGNLRTQGAALRKLGQLTAGAQGAELLGAAVAIARQLKDPELLHLALLAQAERLADDDPDQARQLAAEANRSLPDASPASFLADGWLHRLRIAWHLAATPDQALAPSYEVLAEVEALRSRQTHGRGEYFSLWINLHQWLAGRLYLQAGGRSVNESPLSPRVANSTEPAALSITEPRWLDQAFQVGESMRGRLLRENLEPVSSAAKDPQSQPSVDLARLQATLGPNEAILIWQLAQWLNFFGNFEGGSWLLAVHRQGVRLYALPDAAHTAPAIDLFTGMFEARDGRQEAVAEKLASRLLWPALADLPTTVDHLILVPDGALNRLPFATFRDPSGELLLARFRLSMAPSATLWAHWQSIHSASQGEGSVLVLADPRSADGEDGDRESTESISWRPLPGARREAQQIRRRLGRKAHLLLGSEATESSLHRVSAGQHRVLHFATHALTDERRGQASGLVLTGDASADGLLELDEIAALDLAGEVVVLAACRSGGGRLLNGEGALSPARAFLQAGASSVVASLWPLRDDEASEFFDPFYHHLVRGADIATALAETQRERAAAGAPAAAWAGVVVWGDGSTVPFPSSRSGSGWLLSALAVAALLLTLWWRKRK